MNKKKFIEVLRSYEIDFSQMYEDLSELGIVLWNNDKTAVKIVHNYYKAPSMEIVVLNLEGVYLYFDCVLDELDGVEVNQVLDFIKINNASLLELAEKEEESLIISIEGKSLIFSKCNN